MREILITILAAACLVLVGCEREKGTNLFREKGALEKGADIINRTVHLEKALRQPRYHGHSE